MNQEALARSHAPSIVVPKPRSAAHVILETFAHHGMRAAFGIPGGLVSAIYDAVADEPRIALVHTRHEAMAAFAAMGHALVTGKPALVLTTGGPGLTNAITGIASAHVEGLPMIVVAGDVPFSAAGRGAIQDASTNGLDAVAMMRTVTRWSARIESPAGALGAADHAMRVAMGPRPGPVFLSLPLDVSTAPAERLRLVRAGQAPEPPPDEDACRAAARALSTARRPLIVVGNGARGAAREVRALAERLSIPVVTSPHAKGIFPDSHPLCLGGIGLGQDDAALEYIDGRPDVVLVVGSRLNDLTTNGWATPIAGTSETIQIDRDAVLLGRNCSATLAIVGDARAAIARVALSLPEEVRVAARAPYTLRDHAEPPAVPGEPLSPGRVLRRLQVAFPEAMWTLDQGEHCAFALHHLRVEEPDELRTMIGLASMGSGIGTGIGAAHALGAKRRVVAVCGDGGFAMHAGEVLTCVEHGIDVVLVVFNDGRWNMVHHGFKAVYGRRPASLPSRVADLAGVAASFGAVSHRVQDDADLEPTKLRALAGLGRPLLIDVRFEAGMAISVQSRSAALRDLKNRGGR